MSPPEQLDPASETNDTSFDALNPVRQAILLGILSRYDSEPDSLRWLMLMEIDMRRAGLWPDGVVEVSGAVR